MQSDNLKELEELLSENGVEYELQNYSTGRHAQYNGGDITHLSFDVTLTIHSI